MLPKLLVSIGIFFLLVFVFYVLLYFNRIAFIGQECGGYTTPGDQFSCFPGLVCKDLVPGLADESGRCELP